MSVAGFVTIKLISCSVWGFRSVCGSGFGLCPVSLSTEQGRNAPVGQKLCVTRTVQASLLSCRVHAHKHTPTRVQSVWLRRTRLHLRCDLSGIKGLNLISLLQWKQWGECLKSLCGSTSLRGMCLDGCLFFLFSFLDRLLLIRCRAELLRCLVALQCDVQMLDLDLRLGVIITFNWTSVEKTCFYLRSSPVYSRH